MRHFICGMARGTDLYFAGGGAGPCACRSGVLWSRPPLRESGRRLALEAEQHRYQAILDQCDFETLVQHRYDRFLYAAVEPLYGGPLCPGVGL